MRRTLAKAGWRRRASSSASTPVGLKGAPGNGPTPVIRMLRLMARLYRSYAERRGNLLDRNRRGHAALGHCGLECWQLGPERRIRAHMREHAFLQHRPHPFDLLLTPTRIVLSRRAHALAVIADRLPQLRNSLAGQC